MLFTKKICLITIAAGTALPAWPQTGNNFIPSSLSLVPPGPEVAALNRYVDVPVNFYTGVPSINFTVYTIQAGAYKLPVTLSYHAGGHKVEDVASNVGLGWSLNAGGQISRIMAGLPDEFADGYINQPPVPAYPDPPPADPNFWLIRDYAEGIKDAEPDFFYLSAPDVSAKFVFDKQTRQPNFFPYINAKLETPFITPANSGKWKLTANDGTVYFFEDEEVTSTVPVAQRGPSSTYTSAWWLSKILLPNSTDSITFEYENHTINYFTGFSETAFTRVSGVLEREPLLSYSRIVNSGKLVNKITFPGGIVEFLYSGMNDMKRCDLGGGKYLKQIIVKNTPGREIKKAEFSYSHFKADGTSLQLQSSCAGHNKEEIRLRLDSVTEMADGRKLPPVKFIYNTVQNLPNRIESNALDHWGYYNGVNNGTKLPSIRGNFTDDYGAQYYISLPGADKKPYEAFTKANVLEEIVHPTGGSTKYTFEQNDCENYYMEGNQLLPQQQVVLSEHINGSVTITPATIAPVHKAITVAPVYVPASSRLIISIYDEYNNLLVNRVYNNYPSQADALDSVAAVTGTNFFRVQTSVTGPGGLNIPAGTNMVHINWQNEILANKKKAGGLRVKTITQSDGTGTGIINKKVFDYTDPVNNLQSSGHVLGLPSYGYFSYAGDLSSGTTFFTRTSAPGNNPGYTQGSVVGYSRIQVSDVKPDGSGALGASEYFFTTPVHYPDIYLNQQSYNSTLVPSTFSFPFVGPQMQNEWRRGQLLKTIIYKTGSAGQLIPVSEKINFYKNYSGPLTPFADEFTPKGKQINAGKGFKVNEGVYGYKPYAIYTGSFGFIDSTAEITYDPGHPALKIENYTRFVYDTGQLLLTATITGTSDGKRIFAEKYYPGHLLGALNDPAGVHQKMVDKNQLAIPVLEKTLNGTALLGQAKRVFKDWGNQNKFLLPEAMLSAIGTAPFEEKIKYHQISSSGKILSLGNKAGALLSYVWGGDNLQPMAEAANAKANDIACTSFEAGGTGGWMVSGNPVADATAPTGRHCHYLNNGTISRTVSTATTYIVSCWKKGTVNVSGGSLYRTGRTVNGWTYAEYQVSNVASITISGTGYIDELRLHPKTAQMTSYTYEPLVGITSQTDANGNIMYYEYDGFGRLKLIRDMDRNVIKVMDYQYQKGITQ